MKHFHGLPLVIVMLSSHIAWGQPVPAEQSGPDRPNILWLVAENMKLDLGIYGARNVSTPNLDGLAAKGQRYTRVFSTSPPEVVAPFTKEMHDWFGTPAWVLDGG